MRQAFTMVELIFVIVIIGILAAVAIPKLAATRDDAKIVKEVNNVRQCLQDLGAKYTAEGNLSTTSPDADPACSGLECFEVTAYGDANGTINIVDKSNALGFCVNAKTVAENMKLDGNHSFGDKKISY